MTEPLALPDPAAMLSTGDVARLVGIPERNLAASIAKLWWSYIAAQPRSVGTGRSRKFLPADVVVIDMLARTGVMLDPGGEVREQLAERIYELAEMGLADEDLPEVIQVELPERRLQVAFRPAWRLATDAGR